MYRPFRYRYGIVAVEEYLSVLGNTSCADVESNPSSKPVKVDAPRSFVRNLGGSTYARTSGANGGSSVVRRSNSYLLPRNVRSYRGSLANALDPRLTRRIPPK
jgi:hypothetical protein